MRKIINFIENIAEDDFKSSFSFAILMTICFVVVDFATSNDVTIKIAIRTILTYFIPTINILYIAYVLFNFHRKSMPIMIALVFVSIAIYTVYLIKSSNVGFGCLYTLFFVIYIIFVTTQAFLLKECLS